MAEVFNNIISNKLPNKELYFNVISHKYYYTSSKPLYIHATSTRIFTMTKYLLYLITIPGSTNLYNLTFLIYCYLYAYNTSIISKYLIYVMRVNTKKHTNNILYSLYSYAESPQQYLIYSTNIKNYSLYKIAKNDLIKL